MDTRSDVGINNNIDMNSDIDNINVDININIIHDMHFNNEIDVVWNY